MTASVLKQDPNAQKVKKNAVSYDRTQRAHFRGNLLFRATKQELNGEKRDVGVLLRVWLSCFVTLFWCPVR